MALDMISALALFAIAAQLWYWLMERDRTEDMDARVWRACVAPGLEDYRG